MCLHRRRITQQESCRYAQRDPPGAAAARSGTTHLHHHLHHLHLRSLEASTLWHVQLVAVNWVMSYWFTSCQERWIQPFCLFEFAALLADLYVSSVWEWKLCHLMLMLINEAAVTQHVACFVCFFFNCVLTHRRPLCHCGVSTLPCLCLVSMWQRSRPALAPALNAFCFLFSMHFAAFLF